MVDCLGPKSQSRDYLGWKTLITWTRRWWRSVRKNCSSQSSSSISLMKLFPRKKKNFFKHSKLIEPTSSLSWSQGHTVSFLFCSFKYNSHSASTSAPGQLTCWHDLSPELSEPKVVMLLGHKAHISLPSKWGKGYPCQSASATLLPAHCVPTAFLLPDDSGQLSLPWC